MRKIMCLLLCIAAGFGLCASAGAMAYKPNGDVCNTAFAVKKADSAAVVKDGKIDVLGGEYERLDISVDPDSFDTDLSVCYGSERMFPYAYNMCSTVEYYFSWDDVHGFNFAVRYKPHKIKQELTEGTNKACPQDDFARQVAINFVSYTDIVRPDEDMERMLYYTVSKSTVTGKYMEGHWNQLGVTGYYDPTPGEDYTVYYEASGYVVCEWSIPFAKLGVKAADGERLYFTIAATAGEDLEGEGNLFTTAYSVSLGDYGFLCQMSGDRQMATAHISKETIKAADSTGGAQDTTASDGVSAPGDSTSSNTSHGGTVGGPSSDIGIGDITIPEILKPVESSEADRNEPATEDTGVAESTTESNRGDSSAGDTSTSGEHISSSPAGGQYGGNLTAPQTGDVTLVFVLIGVAAAVGGVYVLKRRR